MRRLAPGYPSKALELRVTGHGLETADVRKLSKALHAQAEAHAADGCVCCFDLVAECQARLCGTCSLAQYVSQPYAARHCLVRGRGRQAKLAYHTATPVRSQEFLQHHNQSASAEQALPASLWHEWREREPPDAEAPEGPAGGAAADPGPGWLAGGSSGLFGDGADYSKAGLPPSGARHAEHRRNSKAHAALGAASPAAAALGAAPEPAVQGSIGPGPHAAACHGAGAAGQAAAGAGRSRAQRADAPDSSQREVPSAAGSGSGQGSRPREEGSRSMVGNLLSAVGRSVAAWMPPLLRRALDGRSERGSESDGINDGEDAPARDQVRGAQECAL